MYQDMPYVGGGNDPFETSVSANETRNNANNGKACIRVIGVGGAGNNAVNNMIDSGITSAEFIAVNTDAQILACNKAKKKIQIGAARTKGLGAGADPEIGREAAEESKEELSAALEGTDLLFITAGMGGGTGTGAAPVIAKLARDKKILTVAVVTQPFEFEGKRRADNAMRGLNNLKKNVDTLILIPNERIADVVPKNTPMKEALGVADEVLKQGVRGIADLIVTPALINLDFADVRTILKDRGLAHMGVGVAKGENRIVEAVRLAVNCPLLVTTIEGATGVILNVVGGDDLTFDEVKTAATLIHSVVDYSANIIFGACIDPNIRDEVQVTVIATGFPSSEEMRESVRAAEAAAQQPAPQQPVQSRPVQQPQPQPPVRPQQPERRDPFAAEGRGYDRAEQPPYGAAPSYNAPAPDYGAAPSYGAPAPRCREEEGYRSAPPVDPYAAAAPESYEAPAEEPAEEQSSEKHLPAFLKFLHRNKK